MAPRFNHIGTGLVEETTVAVSVGDVSRPFSPFLIVWDPTPIGALSHGSGLDGNDPLLACVSKI